MISKVTNTHNLATLECEAKFCVFEKRTKTVIDPETCKLKRVRRNTPKYYSMVVVSFGYNTAPDVVESGPGCYSCVRETRSGGYRLFGYCPSALQGGFGGKWYFPKFVFDTKEEMTECMHRLGFDPDMQRYGHDEEFVDLF